MATMANESPLRLSSIRGAAVWRTTIVAGLSSASPLFERRWSVAVRSAGTWFIFQLTPSVVVRGRAPRSRFRVYSSTVSQPSSPSYSASTTNSTLVLISTSKWRASRDADAAILTSLWSGVMARAKPSWFMLTLWRCAPPDEKRISAVRASLISVESTRTSQRTSPRPFAGDTITHGASTLAVHSLSERMATLYLPPAALASICVVSASKPCIVGVSVVQLTMVNTATHATIYLSICLIVVV